VLKRELLYVPFFGWAMAMLRPIAIDRDNPKGALKQVAKKGDELLKDGVWVLIFPEGTRVPYGTIGKFSRGGTAGGAPPAGVADCAQRRQVLAEDRLGQTRRHDHSDHGEPMYAEGRGPRAIAD
jgi:1-acyl-sn-glycerol-3-phosphate acyltransferase